MAIGRTGVSNIRLTNVRDHSSQFNTLDPNIVKFGVPRQMFRNFVSEGNDMKQGDVNRLNAAFALFGTTRPILLSLAGSWDWNGLGAGTEDDARNPNYAGWKRVVRPTAYGGTQDLIDWGAYVDWFLDFVNTGGYNVTYWILDNEITNGNHLHPDRWDRYLAMLDVFATKIRAARGMSWITFSVGYTKENWGVDQYQVDTGVFPKAFVDYLHANGGGLLYDAIDIHGEDWWRVDTKLARRAEDLKDYILNNYSRTVRIVSTETNTWSGECIYEDLADYYLGGAFYENFDWGIQKTEWTRNPGTYYYHLTQTEVQQASHFLRASLKAFCQGGCKIICYAQLVDRVWTRAYPPKQAYRNGHFSTTDDVNYTPKLLVTVVNELQSWLDAADDEVVRCHDIYNQWQRFHIGEICDVWWWDNTTDADPKTIALNVSSQTAAAYVTVRDPFTQTDTNVPVVNGQITVTVPRLMPIYMIWQD